MFGRIKLILIVLGFFTLFISDYSFSQEPKIIYLVRHAEKQLNLGKDPELTTKGILRAKKLAKILKNKNITAIYSTQYQRTMQTAVPLAKENNLQIKTYNPKKLNEFAKQLQLLSSNILVVGHSNTTPELVKLLGGKDFGKIDESEYDRLYKLIFNGLNVQTELLKFMP